MSCKTNDLDHLWRAAGCNMSRVRSQSPAERVLSATALLKTKKETL